MVLLADVVLLPACPCCLPAFPAWMRFGGLAGQGCQVIVEDCGCLAGLSVAAASREVKMPAMSRLGIRALPGPACGGHWCRQLPLDTRHSGIPSAMNTTAMMIRPMRTMACSLPVTPGLAGRRRRLIRGACSLSAGNKKLAKYF